MRKKIILPTDFSKNAWNAISYALEVVVFPAEDQSNEQQQYDETKCYDWAVQRTRIDPRDIKERREDNEDDQIARPNTGPDGSVIGGAVKGAVIGALIGAITGNAKKGVKIGAIAGGAAGLGGKIARNQQSRNEYEQDVANQEIDDAIDKKEIEKFKKAFCTCLDAKGYSTSN